MKVNMKIEYDLFIILYKSAKVLLNIFYAWRFYFHYLVSSPPWFHDNKVFYHFIEISDRASGELYNLLEI